MAVTVSVKRGGVAVQISGRAESPRLPLPCRFVGAPAGPKGWHVCEHPNPTDDPRIPDGDVVCATGCNGKCTPRCAGYERFGPVAKRHLVYHVYPVKGRTWRMGVDQLRGRWPLFTGTKVVAVAEGAGLDPVADVAERLPRGTEVIPFKNDPKLREVVSWVPLWDRVLRDASPDDAILYCHAKGVTRPLDPGNSCHWWASLSYALCLDHWPAVESLLSKFPVAGPFKKIGQMFAGSASRWHYSGTFFWVRAGDFATRPWRTVDPAWYGTESWPGLAYRPDEGGELLPVGRGLDPYDPNQWEARVRPAHAAWLKSNPPAWPGSVLTNCQREVMA